MKFIIGILILISLSACGAGQFGTSYRSYLDPVNMADVIMLEEKQEPIVIPSNDIDQTVQTYREHNYLIIGESAFNGIKESSSNAKRQAKDAGATHVIISAEYTDTQSELAFNYQTNYRTIYVNRIKMVDDKPVHYTEAVTIRDTVAVPYTRYYNNFDQAAVYLVRSIRPRKFGLILTDLDFELRKQLGRNTGAYIDLVLNGSPAFLANIMPQDILLAIDGVKILNKAHAESHIAQMNLSGKKVIFTVIHQGQQKNISLEFY